MSKSNMIAAIATSIWSFFGGFFLWDTIGGCFKESGSGSATGVFKVEPNFGFLIFGCIMMGVSFAMIYSKWARGNHSIKEGLSFGLWITALIGLGSGFINYSTSNVLNLSGFFVDLGLSLIYFCMMGITASLVSKKYSV